MQAGVTRWGRPALGKYDIKYDRKISNLFFKKFPEAKQL
jgi:hypothetical protein